MAHVTELPARSAVFRALRESTVATVLAAFLVVDVVLAVVADLAGFPTVAAMIVAFAVLITITTALFVVIPVSALSLLD